MSLSLQHFKTKKTLFQNVILDEDNMDSDSDKALATQQSIKSYVDNNGGGGGGGGGASNLNGLSDVTLSGVQNNQILNYNSSSSRWVNVSFFNGNSLTATTLASARNIAGNSFDGSQDITISPTDLTGSIPNSKLSNNSVSFGGISLELGETDATPAFNLTDATNYPTSSLSGNINLTSQVSGALSIANGGTGATNASDARTALGVDAAGTDNSTPVTLASDPDNYLSISGQTITSGIVPISLGGTGLTSLGSAGQVLKVNSSQNALEFGNVSGGGGSSTFLGLNDTPSSFTSDNFLKIDSSGNGIELISDINLASHVTGTLPVGNGGTGLTDISTLLNTNNTIFKTISVSGQNDIVADSATDTLTLVGAGGATITTDNSTDTITITTADTQLTDEQVQDVVGAMFSSNTETGITTTYQDSDGTIDLNVFSTIMVTESNNNFALDGEANATISLSVGNKYRFDLSNVSTSHPFSFSSESDGGGTVYTTSESWLSSNGTQGSPGAYVQIIVSSSTPDVLYYYCSNHSGMGGIINIHSYLGKFNSVSEKINDRHTYTLNGNSGVWRNLSDVSESGVSYSGSNNSDFSITIQNVKSNSHVLISFHIPIGFRGSNNFAILKLKKKIGSSFYDNFKGPSETNKVSATIDLTTSVSGYHPTYTDANYWVDQNYQFTFIDTNPLEGGSTSSDIKYFLSSYYGAGQSGYPNNSTAAEITFGRSGEGTRYSVSTFFSALEIPV